MLDEGELARLLDAVGRGDQEAVSILYRRVGSLIYGIAHRILRDPGLAEDASHQAFLKVWRSAHRFDPGKGKPTTWITVVTRNAALDSRPRETTELPEDLEAAGLDYDYIDPGLRRALARLPEKHRNALLLMYIYGLSHSELAERLGAPLGTVKSWVRRSMVTLKESLIDEHEEPRADRRREALAD